MCELPVVEIWSYLTCYCFDVHSETGAAEHSLKPNIQSSAPERSLEADSIYKVHFMLL